MSLRWYHVLISGLPFKQRTLQLLIPPFLNDWSPADKIITWLQRTWLTSSELTSIRPKSSPVYIVIECGIYTTYFHSESHSRYSTNVWYVLFYNTGHIYLIYWVDLTNRVSNNIWHLSPYSLALAGFQSLQGYSLPSLYAKLSLNFKLYMLLFKLKLLYKALLTFYCICIPSKAT